MSKQMLDNTSRHFREFEQEGWQRIPAEYDEGFAGLTPQAVQPLLDAAHVGKDSDVLDVATGPGYVAAAAAERGARVVGIDFSARMVDQARRRHPELEFRVGDAEEIDFEAGRFDAVLMNFGLLHLAQPEEALQEAFRVLRRGGWFAFTVWAEPKEAIGFGMVLRAVERYGDLDVALPAGPPFFRFSNPHESVRTLREAGFVDVQAAKINQTWRLRSADALFEIMKSGTVRTAGLLRAQSSRAQFQIQQELQKETGRYQVDGAIELPMPAMLAWGRKT